MVRCAWPALLGAAIWLGMAGSSPCAAAPTCVTLPRGGGTALTSLVAAPDGALWYADAQARQLVRIGPDGREAPASVAAPAMRLSSLALGPDGQLWFTREDGARIGRRPLPDGNVAEYALAGPARLPRDIVAGPDGAMWFHDPMQGEVGRLSADGGVQTFPGPAWRGRRFSADGLASAGGQLWLTASVHNAIYRVSPAGEFTRLDLSTPNALPQAIAAGPGGQVWFAMFGAQRLGRVGPDGRIDEFDVAPHNPGHLAVAPDGTVWFTMRTASLVGRLRPDGRIEKFPCGLRPAALAIGADGRPWALGEGQLIRIDEPQAGSGATAAR